MSDPKYVLFWGDATPRLKREPAADEIYLWTKTDDTKLTYVNGAWEPLDPAEADA